MSEKNFFIRNIPNLFTLLNLFCGLVAILLSFDGRNNLILAAYFIYIAAVFDFFDGFAARALKATSPVGKELDSLADMVSFGVAPSVILYALLKSSMQVKQFAFALPTPVVFALLSPFLIALFSAIRLAKFNVDDKQKETFLGLATPACAMLVASIPFISKFDPHNLVLIPSLEDNIYFFIGSLVFGATITKPVVLIPMSIILSVLLVVNMPMFSLKFKNFSFEDNKLKYIFLFFSILLFSVLQVLSVPIIFILYITFSIFNNLLNRSLSKRAEESLDRLFQD